MRTTRTALAVASALAATLSNAVSLDGGGLGQALIYPYYTVRAAGGNEFNTYLSVANQTAQAKVVRVTFREARNSRVVQSFNLYLAPNDLWAAAVVSTAFGSERVARIVSTDASCVNPPFETGVGAPGRTFSGAQYIGAFDDQLGTEIDRTREGWIEMIEMATLVGDSAAAITPTLAGAPGNCTAVQGTPSLTVAAPTGGLSGTLTLINVANGQDFSVNAEALANLTTAPFYRPPDDPYPAFDAAEVTPVSTFTANGFAYRSVWARGVDAVSAVLMRSEAITEIVLDSATRSKTDLIATFPTRSYYGSGTATQAPFLDRADVRGAVFNRETAGTTLDPCDGFTLPPAGCRLSFRPVSTDIVVSNGATHVSPGGSFGSGSTRTSVAIPGSFQNGMLTLALGRFEVPLTSLPASTRMDLATGAVTSGAHVITGLPLVGFGARTFENGIIQCGNATCQANYGSAFPFRYRRSVTTP